EHRIEEYNMMVGNGIHNLFLRALPEEFRTESEAMRMKEFFIPYYDAHKCDLTRPYKGIQELLKSLSENGIALAVASNKYQDGTEKLVKHFFGDDTFKAILGQREGFPIKPDPAIVYQAMAQTGVSEKGNVIYLGDSDVDMKTGANAGVDTIGVTWGFRSREELTFAGAVHLADNPEQVYKIIMEE
ncbi:MAG: HAD family hydrolase, partial [Candidatus Cryptobacteroides sp.]